MQKKLPAFQFYPGDWRKDPGVQSLDLKHRGAWIEILCMMHESDRRGILSLNGKPMPNEAISRQLSVPLEECEKILETLIEYGVASKEKGGAIVSRRMVRDEKKREKTSKALSDAGKLGAKARWKNNGVGHSEAIERP